MDIFTSDLRVRISSRSGEVRFWDLRAISAWRALTWTRIGDFGWVEGWCWTVLGWILRWLGLRFALGRLVVFLVPAFRTVSTHPRTASGKFCDFVRSVTRAVFL